ncbi:hypothetical protein MNBD_BACTEROID05-545 [hydrothermal vent metagenome]|uniref:Transposase DDE domain-containing protein n=1 Tax=hydrothermal vent metagenome TaxID=652676 RepID=A0A3B0T0J5_9ZZZZ
MKLTVNLSKVELKRGKDSITGRIGLSWVTHCAEDFGLRKIVEKEYAKGKKHSRGIPPWKKVMSGMMMMLSGGERVEDVEVLRADEGLLESLGWEEINCPDTMLNFIGKKRNNARNRKVNEEMVIESLRRIKTEELTYDNDATYLDSNKKSAKYSYQKRKQFSGLIGSIANLGMINTVEYRAGNKSPQTGILNQLRKAIGQAKKAGKRITKFRSDSAAYQDKIITECEKSGINWYITVDRNEGIKKLISGRVVTDWRTMYGESKERHDIQWSQAEYVVSKGYKVRVLILRWKNPSPDLFNTESYCYHVIGTNDWEIDPMKWLEFHNGRMGTIEHINKEIKRGLGCDYTPSHEFEKNRGYFILGVLAHNVLQMMKLFYFDGAQKLWTIKTVRHYFINVCGKIVKSGRKFYCQIVNVPDKIFALFRHCKSRLGQCYY